MQSNFILRKWFKEIIPRWQLKGVIAFIFFSLLFQWDFSFAICIEPHFIALNHSVAQKEKKKKPTTVNQAMNS